MQENVAIIMFSVAMTCLAAFAIFVPLVIIPSIKDLALTYDFDPVPVHCVTVDFVINEDPSECRKWSFCRQGCEKPMMRCHQVIVNYRKTNDSLPSDSELLSEEEWTNKSLWDETNTKLLINAKGCGDAPVVRCNEFGEIVSEVGKVFECYYSRRNPRYVVIDPAWIYPSSSLVVTLGLPSTLLTVALFIFAMLAAHFCPCVPTLERLKPEGIPATQQGRYSSIQNVNPARP